jgi:branched-chain amino acid transport system substrate-binding protein
VGAAAIAAALGVGACGSDGGGAGASGGGEKGPIVIQHMVSTTGPAAPYRLNTQPPTEMALDKINAEGGINGRKLEEKAIDTRLDPTLTVREFQSLPKDLPFVMGPEFSTEYAAVAPLANRMGLPTISSLATIITIAGENRPAAFQTTSNFARLAQDAVGTFAKAQPGVKKVVMLADEKDVAAKGQGEAISAALKSTGAGVVATVGFETGASDFAPVVAKAKSAGADGVLVAALPADAAGVVQEVRRQGIDLPILVSLSGFASVEFTQNSKGILGKGIYGVSQFYADDPRVKGFVDEYKKRTKQVPPAAASNVYEAWMMLAKVLREKKIDGMSTDEARKAIIDGLTHVSVEGVAGEPISFNKDGYIDRPGLLLKLESDGTVTEVK